MLVGREREQRDIDAVLETARGGSSATLALVGEPGIGKTALLDHAAEHADAMRLLRARGIESEAHVPFASLLELLRPALGMIDQIPRPQAAALEGALALRPALAQERFAVGAATLNLLAAYAEDQAVAVLVDDAHWLDAPSSQALLFAVRRLVADPIAVLVAVREGEPSLLDGADLPTMRVGGLSPEAAARLLEGLAPEFAERLHGAAAGNPLGLLELGRSPEEIVVTPDEGPLLVPARISQAFMRRVVTLGARERQALLLAATCHSGDLGLLQRAARIIGVDLGALVAAERLQLVSIQSGQVEFRHPLVRSAVYADASPDERRSMHRVLASALPDLDLDRRAWHLAAAAAGIDLQASLALEQAGTRARDRSAYATAALAFERAGRLESDARRRARLLFTAAEECWNAGLGRRALALLDEARACTDETTLSLEIDGLAGHIAARQGPVMRGHAILTAAAERADPERAIAMLVEAAAACFYAGNAVEMITVAERARELLAPGASVRVRFMSAVALGMARVAGGDAAAGSEAIQSAVALAARSPELLGDPRLLPWLATAPIFLREAGTGRSLLALALAAARERSALGELPLVLGLIALDHATTERWAVAEAMFRESIDLARETGQQTDLVFGLSGLAHLRARRGRESECRENVSEALALCERLGTRLHEVWAIAALGMLELGAGRAELSTEHFERQQRLLDVLSITDPDVSPAPELVDAMCRLRRLDDAQLLSDEFSAAAEAKGQPWSLARALRARALVAEGRAFPALFEQALEQHALTPDVFERARTQLAYGARLRRARSRRLARTQLRAALDQFEALDARPWAGQARAELLATGETVRRREPATLDELTPQELQIALMLAAGSTTREAATALFLSPKTIEYHLRHVYLKLGIHSREELARALRRGRDDPST